MSDELDKIYPLTESELIARDMRDDDLTRVVSIECSAQVSPWSRLSFEESLNKKNLCRVIEAREQVVAYHVCSAVLDELHILNLVTAKPQQGIGLGHRLMQDILEHADALNSRKVFLEVRESNSVAQNLYLKWQFRQIALRKDYYRIPNTQGANDQSRENALVFVRDDF